MGSLSRSVDKSIWPTRLVAGARIADVIRSRLWDDPDWTQLRYLRADDLEAGLLTAFWTGIGNKLADRLAAVSIPALVFWSGGLLAWASSGRSGQVHMWGRWLARQNGPIQVAVLVAIITGIGVSGVLVSRLSVPAMRLLAGDWPAMTRRVRDRLVKRVATRREKLKERFDEIEKLPKQRKESPELMLEHVKVDRKLHWLPSDGVFRPTSVGNILLSAANRPRYKYGLNAEVVWPRLWLLLPDTARAELEASRRSLDLATSACVWGVLFLAFTPLAWWAAVVGAGAAALSCRFWLRSRAEVFADLLDSVFDLYRARLYTELRRTLPTNAAEEVKAGELLTSYLWRGPPA